MSNYDYYAQRNISRVGRWQADLLATRLHRDIAETIPPHGSVVEIGPGLGFLARKLTIDFDYSAYEPNSAMATNLVASGIAVRQALVPPLQEESQSRNAVVAVHVLEHMHDHAAALFFLKEVFRVLVPGGAVFLIFPDYNDWGKLFYDGDYTHSYPTTEQRVCQMLTDTGFQLKRAARIYGALPIFPGLLCNACMHCVNMVVNPLLYNGIISGGPLRKARFLFLRANYLIATKPKADHNN
jgi:SAM-dependent methyltransferase